MFYPAGWSKVGDISPGEVASHRTVADCRGSGKSHLLEHVLRKLGHSEYLEQCSQELLNVDATVDMSGSHASSKSAVRDSPISTPSQQLHVVYIDGRVVADDMAAMQEISRQLSTDASSSLHMAMAALAQPASAQHSTSTNTDAAKAAPDNSSHSKQLQDQSTLRSVQAASDVAHMLSGKALGPAANVALRGTHVTAAGSGGHLTYEKHMAFVADALRAARARGSTVLLVLDEFDAFARQSKQTLLYHLLDLTQSKDARFGLVGLTSRLDVVDLLEKRLRSRFSHSKILLSHPSWETCCQVVSQALNVPAGSKTPRLPQLASLAQTDMQESLLHWNSAVGTLTTEAPSAALAALLRGLQTRWERGYSLGSLLRCTEAVLMHAYAMLSMSGAQLAQLSEAMVQDALVLVDGDSRAELLHGLSQVELCLVIAMAHLHMRGEDEYNFQAAWRQYVRFLKGDLSHSLAVSHAVALSSFLHLVQLDLVRFLPGSAAARSGASNADDATVAQQFSAVALQVDASAALAAVSTGIVPAPAGVRQWAASGSAETGGE